MKPIPIRGLACAAATVLILLSQNGEAGPRISRLTPPSDPLKATANTLSRFLPGQRFDLQVTVQPDLGTAGENTVESVTFQVDDALVGLVNRLGPRPARAGFATTGLVPGLAANAAVVSWRAYSDSRPGIHTLRVTARQSDGQTSSEQGNFEIVALAGEGRRARNVIILLGDGMGASHRTAARIVGKGYAHGKAQDRLAMDAFPVTGMVMTSSLNSIVTDSSPGMSNYVTGNKAQNNQEGVFPDDTVDAFDNPRVEYLSEYLHRTQGQSLGIVTTADVFDATPAANAVHTANRGQGTGIVDQFLQESGSSGLTVLMGGGRKWFLPNAGNAIQPSGNPAAYPPGFNGSQRRNSSDYTLPAELAAAWGVPDNSTMPLAGDTTRTPQHRRDLIAEFQHAGWTYAADRTALDGAFAAGVPSRLLGLFSYSNMNVAYDKINGRRCAVAKAGPGCSAGAAGGPIVADYGFPDQPMLDEMADKAIRVLDQNPKGFVLMIEGASIDKQSHLMDSDRWILEVLEFDRAVQVARNFAAGHPDTLVLVTADHECSGAALIGAATVTAAQLHANALAAATLPVLATDGSAQAYPSASSVTRTTLIRDGSATAVTRPGSSPAASVVGNYEAARFPKYTLLPDGYPAESDVDGKLLIGYGANADRYETWLANLRPTQDAQQPFVAAGTGNPYPGLPDYPANASVRNSSAGYLITGQVSGDQAVHTATDVPLSAMGRGAGLFTGVFDNTDVFFKIGQAVLKGARSPQRDDE
jgi:alkaline phosphatase